jgi:hypothetical protein
MTRWPPTERPDQPEPRPSRGSLLGPRLTTPCVAYGGQSSMIGTAGTSYPGRTPGGVVDESIESVAPEMLRR